MSTGAECNFWEEAPRRWFYRLQHYPYGETSDFDTFGPFTTFGRAYQHLHENHANPGGFSTRIHETEHVHEWVTGDAWEPVGVEVMVRVDSLGPNPDPAALLALIGGLPPDHPAIRIIKRDALVPNITQCEACHKRREEVPA